MENACLLQAGKRPGSSRAGRMENGRRKN